MRHDTDKPPRASGILRDKIFLTDSIPDPAFLKEKDWWKGAEWACLVGELCFAEDAMLRELAWLAWTEYPLRQRLHLYGLDGGANNPLCVRVNFGYFEAERAVTPEELELSVGVDPFYLQRWERGLRISESAIRIYAKVGTEWGTVEAEVQMPSVPLQSWLRQHPVWALAMDWEIRITERNVERQQQDRSQSSKEMEAVNTRRQQALASPWAAWVESMNAYPPFSPPIGDNPPAPTGWQWAAKHSPAEIRGQDRQAALRKWIQSGEGPPPWESKP